MPKTLKDFVKCTSGSFVPLAVVAMVPLLGAVGLAVDYSSGVTARAEMQDALDSAALSIMTLPRDMAKADREAELQSAYVANRGAGTVRLDSYAIDPADGTARLSASAGYEMPTTFMRIAAIPNVGIAVKTSVSKKPTLVEATFKIVKVSGWWNKTMTLYGKKYGQTTHKKLMEIGYVYNNAGEPKGYGTTTISALNTLGNMVQLEQQVCTTSIVKNFNGAPKDAITTTSGGKKYLTTCQTTPANGKGAAVDVSEMEDLYLQMDVPSGNPNVLKSNDPATSDRLYIEDVEVEAGQTVDIFSAVACGTTGTQAWEDGGTTVPTPVINADFFYSVTGKCDFSQRVSQTTITQ